MNQVFDRLKNVRSSFFPAPHVEAAETLPPNCEKNTWHDTKRHV